MTRDMSLAKVIPFGRPRRDPDGPLRPGDRVVGLVDGVETEGVVAEPEDGDPVFQALWYGGPDAPKEHVVPVHWGHPEMVDASQLRRI